MLWSHRWHAPMHSCRLFVTKGASSSTLLPLPRRIYNFVGVQEVQVEQLMEKAVAQSERPWLILLTTLSSISAILLTLILLRLQQGGHL